MRPPAPRTTPLEIVVDGTDGAGKTACVHFLTQRLCERGTAAVHYAPYREQEVYPLWAESPRKAAQTIVTIIDRFRAQAGSEVIVWDRGWPTAFISTADARARARFDTSSPITLLLLGSMERTRLKAQTQPDPGVWVADEALVRRFNLAYHQLRGPAGATMLRFGSDRSDRFDFEAIWLKVERALDTK